MRETGDELNGLWFETVDRERVATALADDAAAAGFLPVSLDELAPYGRWLHGEEDPTVRRYALAPAGSRWTGVFPSQPDWDHDRAPALAERLGCRAACLMLHDGDVFTLHLHDRGRLVAAHVSSPVHFDEEPRPVGELDLDPASLLPACRPGTTEEQVVEALTPPGRIDVDGRLALERTAALLELGPHALLCYALLVDESGLALREEFADFRQLCFRLEDEDSDEESSGEGRVLPFRQRPRT